MSNMLCNHFFRSCVVRFGRDKIVELKDNCNNRVEGRNKVCVESYESRSDGIFACNCKIDKMSEDLKGEFAPVPASRCMMLCCRRVVHRNCRREEQEGDGRL